jgi:hypothetical protein
MVSNKKIIFVMMVVFVTPSTENVTLLSAHNLLIILCYQNKHMTNYVGVTFLLPISKINMTVMSMASTVGNYWDCGI